MHGISATQAHEKIMQYQIQHKSWKVVSANIFTAKNNT